MQDAGQAPTCAACGASGLVRHLAVKGEVGSEGLIPTSKDFGTALGDIVRCPECGHMQLDVFPTDEDLAAEYAAASSEDYVEEEAGQRETARRVLAKVERHCPPGRLLDLGPWVGFYMAEAAKRGWSAVGVEPSAFAADHARERLGLDVRNEDLYDAEFPEGSFDAVLMGDVLEHLTRTDEALQRIRRWLVPGGVLVLLLPNAGSRLARLLGRRWWSIIPTHVHYFTPRSVRTMLARHGFEVVHLSADAKAFTVRYYLEKGGGYAPSLSRALVRAAEAVGVADRVWAPDFRDRMTVIARSARDRAPARDRDRSASRG